jgi:hypothetical protein
VEAIGKMAELPQDISPFQIGTSGVYKGVAFTLIGRLRIGWADGAWNEWFMFSDDGRKGWLAEVQGSLAVNFEIDEKEAPETFPTLGEKLKLQNKTFSVADIKETECIGSDGELPFTAPKGRKTKAVDLIGKNGEFASVEYSPPEPIRIYVGEYVEFDDLKFSNLRELTGWEKKQGKRSDASW